MSNSSPEYAFGRRDRGGDCVSDYSSRSEFLERYGKFRKCGRLQTMKREFQIFLTAIMFYTRIPVPRWVDHSQEYLNESTRYFPLMGWIVGSWAAMAFYAAHFVFPLTVSVLLSMIASILITGAFHEDGFADMCDGFGGGGDKMQVLEIMKDSRIGTYGALGLMLMVVLKFIVLCAIPAVYIPVLLIIAH